MFFLLALLSIAFASDCTFGKIEGCGSCELSKKMEKCISCYYGNSGDSYYSKPNSDGKCDKCAEHCKECEINKGGKCDEGKCEYGYVFDSESKTCKACDANCNSGCTSNGAGKCDSYCKDGYRLVTETGNTQNTCEACTVTNCVSCASGKEQCTSCKAGYALKDDACVKCSDANCISCSAEDQSICTLCENGYSVKENKCVKCDEHCSKTSGCSTNGVGKCDSSCESGYYLDTSASADADKYKCKKCIDHCISCTTGTKCETKCETGYGWNDDKTKCVKCIDHCNKCNIDNAKCDTDSCETGYYKDSNGLCQKCTDHCNTCNDGTNGKDGKCDDDDDGKGCEQPFYMKNVIDGKCYVIGPMPGSNCTESNYTKDDVVDPSTVDTPEERSQFICMDKDASYMTSILLVFVALITLF